MLPLRYLILIHVRIMVVGAITLNTSSLILPNLTLADSRGLSAPFDRQCSGPTYGGDPVESCADALLQIRASDTTVRSYGIRGYGQFDIDLPKRYISGG